MKMLAESYYIPKNETGDDATFFSQSAQVIGVADGVGGWSTEGIDAGEYARQLMRNAYAAAVKEYHHRPIFQVDPKEVLRQAFLNTAEMGSSTACIISFAAAPATGKMILRAANVGDSGFMVIRGGGGTVYRSPVQQHSFNFPYQLEYLSEKHSHRQAAELAVEVESGDVVVAGTDGLFDNLFAGDIERIVGDYCVDSMFSLSETLARAAHGRSRETTTVSPFQVAANEAGIRYVGGKLDDITVVVAYVVPGTSSSYGGGDGDVMDVDCC
ncbi:hypothetical protein ABFX02_08G087700 [Erythranthe guttata]